MILADRYLMLIAIFVLLLNVVNTSGEYLFGRYVVSAATTALGNAPNTEDARQTFIGSSYSSYFSYVNLTGFLLQLFVVSRLLKYLGVGRSLFIHPIVALCGYVMMLRAPSFGMVRALKIADNSLDYSLGNTTKQALWLPTSRDAKYKAKQAVDSFCVRAGDVVSAGIVYMGELTSVEHQRVRGAQRGVLLWLAVYGDRPAAALASRPAGAGGVLMTAHAELNLSSPDLFGDLPLSSRVRVEFGAQSRAGKITRSTAITT
jgi:AAA family ATP:ADP antiporter